MRIMDTVTEMDMVTVTMTIIAMILNHQNHLKVRMLLMLRMRSTLLMHLKDQKPRTLHKHQMLQMHLKDQKLRILHTHQTLQMLQKNQKLLMLQKDQRLLISICPKPPNGQKPPQVHGDCDNEDDDDYPSYDDDDCEDDNDGYDCEMMTIIIAVIRTKRDKDLALRLNNYEN